MISFHASFWGLSPDLLLARLLIVSAELVWVAALVHLFIVLARIRCPRMICYLWLAVLIKPLFSLMAGSILTVPLFNASLLPAPVVESRNVAPAVTPSGPERPAVAPAAENLPPPPEPPQADVPERRLTVSRDTRGGQSRPARSAGSPLYWVVLGVWLGGVGIGLARYMHALLRLRNLVRVATRPNAELESTYQRLGRSLGLRALPSLLISDRIESPALVGAFRPVILLPQWLAEKCNDEQVGWSLRHELVHWRWLDSLIIFIRDIVRAVFWFHPAVWWGSRRLTEALETACDHALVQSFPQAGQYAEYLFEILRAIRDRRRIGLAGGLFVTRTQIGRRIAALLDGSVTSAPRLTVRSLAGVLLLSGVILAVGVTVRDPGDVSGQEGETESPAPRLVHFPKNRSLGYCTFVSRDLVEDDFFTEAFSISAAGEGSLPLEARGTITVPAGMMLKLKVTPETFLVDRPFAGLNPDDIQILTFEACSRPGAREIGALSDLSGLIGLSLCGSDAFLKSDPPLDLAAIQSLVALEHLQGLCLPSAIDAEALGILTALPSLTALQIEAPLKLDVPSTEITEDQLAAIGQLTSLTRLTLIRGHPGMAAGLAHLGSLHSLRSLQLVKNSNPELNHYLQYIGSLPALENLGFPESALSDEGLACLKGLSRLRRLDLQGTSISEQGLVHLAALPNLEELDLSGTPIGDAGARHLENLKQLRKLVVRQTNITEAGLASLSRLTALEELGIPSRAATDAGFYHLSKLKSLKRLWPVTSSALTDVGLRILPSMTALESLHIRAPGLTDAALPYIARCHSLRELNLSAPVSDAGLVQLVQLQGLRKLTLHNMTLQGPGLKALGAFPALSELNLVRISLEPGGLCHLRIPATVECLRLNITSELLDGDLACLTGLENLRHLALHTPNLSDLGLAYLGGLRRVEVLSINGPDLPITDAGLKVFETLPTLQVLALRGTQVSEEGLRDIRAKLPGLAVTVGKSEARPLVPRGS